MKEKVSKKSKSIFLLEAGTAVVIILVAALLSVIHTATGGDDKGDTKKITVRPADEDK